MILLDQLMAHQDFTRAVNEVALDYRRRYGFPPIAQVGTVVPDAEQAAGDLEKQGLGPFFVGGGEPVLWRERGADLKYKGKIGFGYVGGIEVELIEPGQGSDFYRNWLDPNGGVVVQHLGFLVKDVDEWAEKIDAPLWIRGRLKLGPLAGDFAYLDTVEQTGIILEFISWTVLGLSVNGAGWFFRPAARLMKLFGKRSISV